MKKLNYEEVATIFARQPSAIPVDVDGPITVAPVIGGLINHSWKVDSKQYPSFLLQRINTSVFHHPDHVQQNYINIWEYAEFEFTGLRIPKPIFYDRYNHLYKDKEGHYWRAFEFIDESFSISIAQKSSQAKATAKTFAKFTAAFDEFNIELLKVVIPNFHDLAFRYQQFEDSLKGESYERMAKALYLIEELKKREKYKFFYELIKESPEEFPTRVMHHDAKIANVLFSKKTGKVICPVDFDTVMPGHYFSDLGDIIRSMACSKDENETDFSLVNIRPDFYEAIIDGYLNVMKKQFTSSEIKYVHHAGILMIYMQSLRFITDYLNNDSYYRIQYQEQNFDRAFNQFTLLTALERFLENQYHYPTYQAPFEK